MITPLPSDTRDQIGPYRLVKAIGAGGSARVDLARIDRAYNFQRHVVIKRPLEHLRADPKAAASLRREAHIGARLRHPNLVGVLDAGTHDGYDYLVLEYVHGGALRTLLQADSPARIRELPLGAALSIVHEVARGLHAAHELADEHGAPLGLVHRDVSPGNILVGTDGGVKLTDFGIAKETRVQTLSGSMHGTVTYMAPEQCRGHAFDRRADIFSLGVILYELVTSHRLFWADNDVASLHKVLSGNVPRPRKLRPTLSTALEEIVMTAVAHEQDRRFTTARDFADAIARHAAEAGELLAARDIARWVDDVLGPRDAPWIGAATVVDVPRALSAPGIDRDGDGDGDDDGDVISLVDLIAQVPADDPPNPTFGPTAPSFADDIDTDPRRDPGHDPRRDAPARAKRKVLAAVVAIGIAGGAAATALVMMRGEKSAATSAKEMSGAPSGGAANGMPSGGADIGAATGMPSGGADIGAASGGAATGMPSGGAGGPANAASRADDSRGDVPAPATNGAANTDVAADVDRATDNTAAHVDRATDNAATDSSRDSTNTTNTAKPANTTNTANPTSTTNATKRPRTRDRTRPNARKPPPSPPEQDTAKRDGDKPPPASTGSQTRPAKVEWTPDMLLPTDPGSGTKKK